MAVVAQNDSIQIDRLSLGPYETNSYVLTCRLTGDSVVVDTPGGANKIIHQLKGTNPRYILIIHAHMDHTEALFTLNSCHQTSSQGGDTKGQGHFKCDWG